MGTHLVRKLRCHNLHCPLNSLCHVLFTAPILRRLVTGLIQHTPEAAHADRVAQFMHKALMELEQLLGISAYCSHLPFDQDGSR